MASVCLSLQGAIYVGDNEACTLRGCNSGAIREVIKLIRGNQSML